MVAWVRVQHGRLARHLPVVPVALIVAVTVAAYAGSFSGNWISDDVEAIARNPLLRSLAPVNLRAIFTSFDDANYIPLKVLSLAVDYRLWGLHPAGYHLTNLALHLANALTIFALLRRLDESSNFALAVALLWAVHPVQVESVAWVSERKNVLSTLFFLLAFHVYLSFSEQPRANRYAALLVLFVCALLSKINTIVLPAITVAYEVTIRRRLRARDLAATVPLLAVGAVLARVHLAGNPVHGASYHGGSLATTLRTSSTVVPRYLALAVAPLRLSTYYPVSLRASWVEPAVLVGIGTVAALAVAAAVLAVRRRPEAFWIIWFAVTLSPMLNLVPFPALMADRYLYVPSVGLLAVLAHGAAAFGRRLFVPGWAMRVLAGAAVAGCAGLTVARVPVFHDGLGLWADWALQAPYLPADVPYRPAPRRDELRILQQALRRDPDSAVLHNNLGAIAFEEGRLTDAIDALERARSLDPEDAAVALNLGRAYLRAGRLTEAVGTLEVAARLEPPSYFAQLNLARAYLLLGDAARARAPLERARAIRPDGRDWPRAWAWLEQLERHGSATPPSRTGDVP